MSNMGNIYSVGELIHKLFDTYRLRPKYDQVRIISIWNRIMPKPITSKVTNIQLKRGVLFLKVESAPLRQELHSLKKDLVKKMNVELGRDVITDVKIS